MKVRNNANFLSVMDGMCLTLRSAANHAVSCVAGFCTKWTWVVQTSVGKG